MTGGALLSRTAPPEAPANCVEGGDQPAAPVSVNWFCDFWRNAPARMAFAGPGNRNRADQGNTKCSDRQRAISNVAVRPKHAADESAGNAERNIGQTSNILLHDHGRQRPCAGTGYRPDEKIHGRAPIVVTFKGTVHGLKGSLSNRRTLNFGVKILGVAADMASRWCSKRRLWLGRVGFAVLCVGAVSGCLPADSWWQNWQSGDWYGYYYENVMVNDAPGMSKPFASARQCLTAMRAYTRNSSRWTGFACARGCVPHKNGAVTACDEVVH